LRRSALVARESRSHFLDDARLVGFPAEIVEVLGIDAPMRNDFVTAAANALEDLRSLAVEHAVHVVYERDIELVGKVEQPPDADAVAVVAPRIIAIGLRLAVLGIVVTAAFAERMHRDVGGDAEREAPAAG